MAAYSVPIPKPRCRCGKPATKQVFNTYNAHCGDFCTKHAAEKVRELDEAARRYAQPTGESDNG